MYYPIVSVVQRTLTESLHETPDMLVFNIILAPDFIYVYVM